MPDPVVRAADEIELVDVTPEVLRDRIACGRVYPRGHAEAALSGAFRVGPLLALRELALRWLAASLTQNLQRYGPGGHADDGRPTRERVMVALAGGPEGQNLLADSDVPGALLTFAHAENAPSWSSAYVIAPGCRHCGPRPGSGPGSSVAPEEPTCISSPAPHRSVHGRSMDPAGMVDTPMVTCLAKLSRLA